MRNFLLAIFITGLFSCQKFDENAPSILAVKIDESSGTNLTATAGENNEFEFLLSDDENLKQLQLKIKTLTGIHAHESEAGTEAHPFLMENQGEWDTLIVSNLGGKEISKIYNLEIPDSVAGGWELSLSVLDDAGNLASEDFVFQIFNPSIPQILFSEISPAPAVDGQFQIALNDSISFDLAVFSPEPLSLLTITTTFGASSSAVVFSDLSASSFNLNDYVLNEFNTPGSYTVNITAVNATGGSNTMISKVLVD